MSTKTAIVTFVLLLLLAGGVVVGVYLVRQNQDVRSRADENTFTAQEQNQVDQDQQNQGAQSACTPPAEVTNVQVDYPACD
jgi:Flp pilus assembly protein TadG